MSLTSKLAEVMAEIHHIPKRGWNDFHKYHFALEADIVDAVRSGLATRQVMLIPSITGMQRDSVGEKGSVLTTLMMQFTFRDGESGEEITRPWLGAGTDKEDKGAYKAMTGGEKYFLLKTFLIPTGDDPEAEGAKPDKPVKANGQTAAKPVTNGEGSVTVSPTPAGPSGPSHDEDGALHVRRIERKATRKAGTTRHEITLSTGEMVATINDRLAAIAEQALSEDRGVVIETKQTQYGTDLLKIQYAAMSPVPAALLDQEPPPLTDSDIPFLWLLPMVLLLGGLLS